MFGEMVDKWPKFHQKIKISVLQNNKMCYPKALLKRFICVVAP